MPSSCFRHVKSSRRSAPPPSFSAGVIATLLVLVLETAAGGQDSVISADRILAHATHLASDALEGRAPGSMGEAATLQYLTDQFRQMGCEPGNPDGTYLQRVPLVGATVTNSPVFVLAIEHCDSLGDSPEEPIELRYGSDFVAWTLHQTPEISVEDAEFVFVGYGVVAPEYDWDDFKDADVAGKILVMLVGDPPHRDPSLFGGTAMTYYGRWTYKFEIAAEKGASGAIVVHTQAEAGYPWEVVVNSWTVEQFDAVRNDKGTSRCAVESWFTVDAAEMIFERAGRSFARACKEAVSRTFRPYSLGLKGSVCIKNELREIQSHNVVARLPGNSPEQADEHLIYTTHWDHLGIGIPVGGDSIYNGALDNASGVAGILEVARAFTESRDRLNRSVLFVMTAAEESGLLGADYYVDHPLYPLEQAVATINVDGLNVWGRTHDVIVVGWGQSDLDHYLTDAVSIQGRLVRPDNEPEKGYYFRSDHFPFAKKGIPALYTDGGVEYRDRPIEWATENRREYLRHRYHKPQDEVDPAWDLSGAVEDMEALFLVGLQIVTSELYPRWSESSEFNKAASAPLPGGGR
jgi:Zn-dependent M28 family amino/carboxypeptidase